MKEKKEKKALKLEPIAVVYGPPPRDEYADRLNRLNELKPTNTSNITLPPYPITSSFTPIPPIAPKKKSTSKKPEENPEDRSDVYGPPPQDSLFGDD